MKASEFVSRVAELDKCAAHMPPTVALSRLVELVEEFVCTGGPGSPKAPHRGLRACAETSSAIVEGGAQRSLAGVREESPPASPVEHEIQFSPQRSSAEPARPEEAPPEDEPTPVHNKEPVITKPGPASQAKLGARDDERADEPTKVCSRCAEEKPLGAFWAQKGGKHGRRPDCKDCMRELRRERYQKQRAREKEPPAARPTPLAEKRAGASREGAPVRCARGRLCLAHPELGEPAPLGPNNEEGALCEKCALARDGGWKTSGASPERPEPRRCVKGTRCVAARVAGDEGSFSGAAILRSGEGPMCRECRKVAGLPA